MARADNLKRSINQTGLWLKSGHQHRTLTCPLKPYFSREFSNTWGPNIGAARLRRRSHRLSCRHKNHRLCSQCGAEQH
jgi:hypothetical protein